MQLIRCVRSYALAFAPCLALLSGCDTIKDHVELGAVEVQFEHFDQASNKLEALPTPSTPAAATRRSSLFSTRRITTRRP